MSTSQTTSLSEPKGTDKISIGTFGYINARNRQRAYNLVIGELRKSGLKQNELAKRLGKGEDVISRLLRRPRNWELDTFSELMFAISGAVVTYSAAYPLAAEERLPDRTRRIEPTKPGTKTERLAIPEVSLKSNNPGIRVSLPDLEFPLAAAA